MSDLLVSHNILQKLAARSSYPVPESGIVFFGFRGLLPLDLGGTDFAASHKVRQVGFNHTHMRCTIGQWRPAEGVLALFPGSTVPDIRGVTAARQNGGIGANMLMLGRYAYDRGMHKPNEKSGHRAFRQGMFFPVWRTVDDLDYDYDDRLDTSGIDSLHYPWDNLHCAYGDNVDYPYYSSSGCQVVSGRPSSPPGAGTPESGPWKRFIENAYGPLAKGQTHFPYMLFSGTEVGKLSISPDGPLDRSVRFGSWGKWVVEVQKALKAGVFPMLAIDEDFGRNTLEALMAFQNMKFGKGQADGVVGPNTASALGIDWPPVVFGEAAKEDKSAIKAMAKAVTKIANVTVPSDWKSAAVGITPRFENDGDPYLGVSGNFDGQGISCGALQWNIWQRSLQPIIRAVGEPAVLAAMPTLGAQMWQACNVDRDEGMNIVLRWQSAKGVLNAVARNELTALMGLPATRAEQDKRIDEVALTALQRAGHWAAEMGRNKASKREFCWFFDMVTQNGSLEGLTAQDVQAFVAEHGAAGAVAHICAFLAGQTGPGHFKDARDNASLWSNLSDPLAIELLVTTFLRSRTSNPKWRVVVINRKGTVAVGKGHVNGTAYDFSKLLS